MQWIKHKENTELPVWLQSELKSVCDCGSDILDGYNEKGRLTRRVCSNPACPYIQGERVGQMCTMLKIPGIKGGNGRKIMKQYNLKSHLEAIPYIVENKPRITLSKLFQLALFYNQSTIFDDICKEYSTVEEFVKSYKGPLLQDILERYDELKTAEMYFDIVPAKELVKHKMYSPVVKGLVVISGEIPDYSPRESFIFDMNITFKGLVELAYSESKRATGCMALICESSSAKTTGKIRTAKDNGIPIMTSKEFMAFLMRKIVEAGKIEELQDVLGTA